MSEPEEQRPTYPPGFEPPTDVDVPWFAWLLWPVAMIGAILFASLLFRGCMGSLA